MLATKLDDFCVGRYNEELCPWARVETKVSRHLFWSRNYANHIDTERIKSNFAIRRLSAEDQKELDDLEIPNGNGRTIDFKEAWGVELWQN